LSKQYTAQKVLILSSLSSFDNALLAWLQGDQQPIHVSDLLSVETGIETSRDSLTEGRPAHLGTLIPCTSHVTYR
jgi:hypothetical protein